MHGNTFVCIYPFSESDLTRMLALHFKTLTVMTSPLYGQWGQLRGVDVVRFIISRCICSHGKTCSLFRDWRLKCPSIASVFTPVRQPVVSFAVVEVLDRMDTAQALLATLDVCTHLERDKLTMLKTRYTVHFHPPSIDTLGEKDFICWTQHVAPPNRWAPTRNRY